MDINENKKICDDEKQEPAKFIKKIGLTTYEVTLYFSETSKENLGDKIKRLIQNDINK